MKTTVNQYDTIYMLYFSYKNDGDFEYCEVYINEDDAYSKKERLLANKEIFTAYVIEATLW